MIFLFWILFSIGVGYLANENGRNPVVWGVVALVISPILAAIVLMLAESGVFSNDSQNYNSQNTVRKSDKSDTKPIGISEFSQKIEKYRDLLDTDVINEKEYGSKKSKLIDRLSKGVSQDNTEDILLRVRDIRDKGGISEKDLEDIKSKIL